MRALHERQLVAPRRERPEPARIDPRGVEIKIIETMVEPAPVIETVRLPIPASPQHPAASVAAPPAPAMPPAPAHTPTPVHAAAPVHAPAPAHTHAPAPAAGASSVSVSGGQPVARPRSARVLTVASGKGGVGKTNVAVNLAIAFAKTGQRVALVDADLGVANADLLCGLLPARRVEQVLRSPGTTLADLAVEAPGGFKLVPGSAGIARMADLTAQERERLLGHLADLEAGSDLIIVDAGAGVGPLVTSLIGASDVCLLVATPEPTAIADAYALVKCTRSIGSGAVLPDGPVWRLLVNNAGSIHEAAEVHNRLRTACGRFLGLDLPLAGWVPSDAQVPASVRARQPLLLRSPNSAAANHVRALVPELRPPLRLADPRDRRRGAGLSRWISAWMRR
jgi:flagellar biosynthesis protein FlhG